MAPAVGYGSHGSQAMEPGAGDLGGDGGAREDGPRWRNEIKAPSEPQIWGQGGRELNFLY